MISWKLRLLLNNLIKEGKMRGKKKFVFELGRFRKAQYVDDLSVDDRKELAIKSFDYLGWAVLFGYFCLVFLLVAFLLGFNLYDNLNNCDVSVVSEIYARGVCESRGDVYVWNQYSASGGFVEVRCLNSTVRILGGG